MSRESIFQALRRVALHDAVRQPFDDGRLADAGLSDQHGIVLGAPRQHLDGAPDLLVAADHRIELAFGRRLGEIARIALQRVVRLLGAGRVGGAPFAQIVDCRVEALRRDARIGEDARGLPLACHGQRLQRPLHGHEAVAGLGGDLLGLVQHARQCRRHMRLRGPASAHLGQLGKGGFCLLQRLLGIAAGAGNEAAHQPFRVVDQHLQQVLGRDLRVAFADGKRLRRLQEPLEAIGEFLEIHRSIPLHHADSEGMAGKGKLMPLKRIQR
jgi:hypothetical protein